MCLIYLINKICPSVLQNALGFFVQAPRLYTHMNSTKIITHCSPRQSTGNCSKWLWNTDTVVPPNTTDLGTDEKRQYSETGGKRGRALNKSRCWSQTWSYNLISVRLGKNKIMWSCYSSPVMWVLHLRQVAVRPLPFVSVQYLEWFTCLDKYVLVQCTQCDLYNHLYHNLI